MGVNLDDYLDFSVSWMKELGDETVIDPVRSCRRGSTFRSSSRGNPSDNKGPSLGCSRGKDPFLTAEVKVMGRIQRQMIISGAVTEEVPGEVSHRPTIFDPLWSRSRSTDPLGSRSRGTRRNRGIRIDNELDSVAEVL